MSEIHLLFLWLSNPELALQRVSDRVHRGGHPVKESIVRRRYGRGLNNLFELYCPLADTWAVYDNSGNGSPSLVAVGEEQQTLGIIQPHLWQTLKGRRS